MMSYFSNIIDTFSTSVSGLRLTMLHLFQARRRRGQQVQNASYFDLNKGLATLQFPHEKIPVPDHGRYKLHNEIDDCIVCDKCAKVCPVNCIEIEPIRSPDVFGETSDGTPKRIYAETFNIDMGKCMFCGLCTTVCPTECLTMTSDYDYSTFDIRDHLFPFSDLSEAESTKRKQEWIKYQEAKETERAKPSLASTAADSKETASKPLAPKPVSGAAKPVFKPRIVPPKPKKD